MRLEKYSIELAVSLHFEHCTHAVISCIGPCEIKISPRKSIVIGPIYQDLVVGIVPSSN